MRAPRGHGSRVAGGGSVCAARWLMVLCLMALVSSCSDEIVGPDTPRPAQVQASPPAPVVTAVAGTPAVPTEVPELTLGLPELEAAGIVELAPLGTFVVAREGAGISRQTAAGEPVQLEIPVYDTPFSDPRVLIDDNTVDGVKKSILLINPANGDGALVMRVVAGGPEDDWLMVQAPARPNNSYVWVRRNDFDFGFTSMRIEIDLAQGGGLTLFDDGAELLQTDIVHGRDSRPIPTHLTYIERGIRGVSLSPAYGTAILSMASFSETLGTFGGGNLPSNFLHGTNQPELMGQRVSSGEIRVPNQVLDEIIETITPGTPVLLFDSSAENKEAILERRLQPAMTMDFAEGGDGATDGATLITPQLWRRCGEPAAGKLLCRMNPDADPQGRYAFITAKPDAGEFDDEIGVHVIPVYDVPGGSPRTLVHQAPDRLSFRLPLRAEHQLGAPLVLWPLEDSPDEEWIRVQAPVRPQRTSVWVRADDFAFGWTNYRLEIDIAGEGQLTLFDDDVEVISNTIVSGRESRPTPLGASFIDQVVDGTRLSPAYGPYVVSIPIYNEVLSTFGGRLAMQQIHGTNQPELMGQRVASGHIRIPNEVLSFIAEQPDGLVGARVVTFDSTGTNREEAIEAQEGKPWQPALTDEPGDQGLPLAVPGL